MKEKNKKKESFPGLIQSTRENIDQWSFWSSRMETEQRENPTAEFVEPHDGPHQAVANGIHRFLPAVFALQDGQEQAERAGRVDAIVLDRVSTF